MIMKTRIFHPDRMKNSCFHPDRIKQFLHAFLFCFFIFITACVIGGCAKCPPITFSSVLDIQADESGTRTMSVTANKKTLQKLFHNSNFSFQSFITANCPKGLEWNYVDTASAYELTFILSFDSLDEYQEKIDALTGIEQFSSISRPQVGVKTGFTLSEPDDVMAVFAWFTDALKERIGLNDSKLLSYLSQQENELIYNGRSYKSQNNALVCNAEKILDAKRIDILTSLSLDKWNRTIYIIFPDELRDNASNVKSYLDAIVPDGIEAVWNNDTTWQLTFSAESFKELCVQTSQLFQSSSKSLAIACKRKILNLMQNHFSFPSLFPIQEQQGHAISTAPTQMQHLLYTTMIIRFRIFRLHAMVIMVTSVCSMILWKEDAHITMMPSSNISRSRSQFLHR